MMELFDALHALGTWSVTALWLPLLAWTLLALPVYVLIQRTEGGHPLVRYRLLQALLFTLPAGLIAAAWVDASSVLAGWSSLSHAPTGSPIMLLPVEVSAAAAPADSFEWSIFHTVGLCTASALLFGAVRLAGLARSMYAVTTLHADAPENDSNGIQQIADRLARDLGLKRPVRVELTDAAVVPLTYGTRRPVILLPRTLTSDAKALRMTLTHELVHVRRFDFLARWAEQFVATTFAVHPGLPWLIRAIERTREMACDAEALRHLRCSRKSYANLLYGFSTQAATPHPAFAVSIAETSSFLKQRIHAMTQFNSSDRRAPRYASFLAMTLVVVLGLGIVACSDAVSPPAAEESTPETATTQSEPLDDSEVFIEVTDRPQLKGGMQALQEAIQYPELAKQAGIEGRVFVQFVVNENGDVINPHVTRGVHEALDQAALNAVKDLSFEPGRQGGEAVKVQMALPVTFKLGDDSSDKAENSSVFEKAGMQQITISLQPDGVTVDGQQSSMSDLTDTVKQKLAATDVEAYVRLKVDGDVAMERVNRVQSALRAANAERVSYSSR
jgi:TonB family protein